MTRHNNELLNMLEGVTKDLSSIGRFDLVTLGVQEVPSAYILGGRSKQSSQFRGPENVVRFEWALEINHAGVAADLFHPLHKFNGGIIPRLTSGISTFAEQLNSLMKPIYINILVINFYVRSELVFRRTITQH